MDRIQFLRDRLDEDELVARGASRPPWKRDYHAAFMHGIKSADDVSLFSGLMSSPDVKHVVRHDPARVLSDVDAKRRTLARCEEALLAANPMLVHFAQETLREMALPYARHPDYPKLVVA